MYSVSLELHLICSPQEYAGLNQPATMPWFDPTWLSLHRSDAHWVVADHDGNVQARCSLWWNQTPTLGDERLGLIGHYAANDDSAGDRLLQYVSSELVARGCSYIVGPMDQNTWRDYRFAINGAGSTDLLGGAFFLEPRNDPRWPEQFLRNGFKPIAEYFSAWIEDLTVRSTRLDRVRRRLAKLGVVIRPLRTEGDEDDMRRVFYVVKTAFANHLLYVDISADEFLGMYRPLEPVIRDDLVLVAEHDGEVVGFCFAVPDLLEAERGGPIQTVIIKTLGVLPNRCYAGLGRVLLEEVHHRAAAIGFRRGIHALVRDVPALRKLSGCYGQECRKYALFGRELSG